MGFEILTIEDGDIDKVDPKYDIFELTSTQKWIPARFRTNAAQMEEDPAMKHLREVHAMEHTTEDCATEYKTEDCNCAMEHLMEDRAMEQSTVDYAKEHLIKDHAMEHSDDTLPTCNDSAQYLDDFLNNLDYYSLVQPRLESEEHESLTFGTPRTAYTTVNKP